MQGSMFIQGITLLSHGLLIDGGALLGLGLEALGYFMELGTTRGTIWVFLWFLGSLLSNSWGFLLMVINFRWRGHQASERAFFCALYQQCGSSWIDGSIGGSKPFFVVASTTKKRMQQGLDGRLFLRQVSIQGILWRCVIDMVGSIILG